ncbi:hypothetical protein [Paenibacillus apis]|uniref:Uncharacterized protein n=1 Tax=Paenibacillus apis TaxID=1792174 RepID=A0A919Y0D4_9BACL|nr:hypothetical protein [Paenibacillus apis]GIO41399.1 hypothetical protein J41TS4_11570 [Paenibacillus apis]
MRKLSLQDVQSKKNNSNSDVNLAVAKFREKTIEEGWSLSRNRPRSVDEIKALNYIARFTILKGIQSGTIAYDKEKRVLRIERYTKG